VCLPARLLQSVERLTLPRIGLLQAERLDRLSWAQELRLSNLFSVSQSLRSVDEGWLPSTCSPGSLPMRQVRRG
jgi:hypothetical protein